MFAREDVQANQQKGCIHWLARVLRATARLFAIGCSPKTFAWRCALAVNAAAASAVAFVVAVFLSKATAAFESAIILGTDQDGR